MMLKIGKIVHNYSKLIFKLSKNKDLTLNELRIICDSLKNHKDYVYLKMISIDKAKPILNLLKKYKISDLTIKFLRILIINKNLDILDSIVSCYNKFLEKKNNIQTVTVITSSAVNLSDFNKVTKILSDNLNKKVTLKNKIDPDILGGAIFEIDNTIIDTSVLKTINSISIKLKNNLINGIK